MRTPCEGGKKLKMSRKLKSNQRDKEHCNLLQKKTSISPIR
jgi:hypothetical protein